MDADPPPDDPAAPERAEAMRALCQAAEALASPSLTLPAVIQRALTAPSGPARRAFALALVRALGVPGAVSLRGQAERDLLAFLETALLNPLRRAGYPFGGSAYDKRQALTRLRLTIDEHLKPLEPSIPRWLHGLDPPE